MKRNNLESSKKLTLSTAALRPLTDLQLGAVAGGASAAAGNVCGKVGATNTCTSSHGQ